MLFLRRFYYDRASGRAVYSSMARGDIRRPTRAEDFALLPELAGRTPDDTGLFEWLEPDAEIEDDFARAALVTVDLSGAEPVLAFSDAHETEETV